MKIAPAVHRVLLVDPFHTGSHRRFIEGIRSHSRHSTKCITGPGVHWKWRMRSFAIRAAKQCRQQTTAPEVIFTTDMMDVATFRGMLPPSFSGIPIVLYFHENQFAYPDQHRGERDLGYAYINLTSAIAADRVIFNSKWNQSSFLEGANQFLKAMPDSMADHPLESVQRKSLVIPPGIENPKPVIASKLENSSIEQDASEPLRMGWVARWEADKRPDRFVKLLGVLSNMNLNFQLVLLGPRPRTMPQAYRDLVQQFGTQILIDGFLETRHAYHEALSNIDVVVSTADHEFFGLAMCEAIIAGAIPVVPSGLAYDEYVPDDLRFDSLDQAARQIQQLNSAAYRQRLRSLCQSNVSQFALPKTVAELDDLLQETVSAGRSDP